MSIENAHLENLNSPGNRHKSGLSETFCKEPGLCLVLTNYFDNLIMDSGLMARVDIG